MSIYSCNKEIKPSFSLVVTRLLIFNSFFSYLIPKFITSNSFLEGFQNFSNFSTNLVSSFRSFSFHSSSLIAIMLSKFGQLLLVQWVYELVKDSLSKFLKA